MNPCEVYKLNCHQCGHAVEIPAGAPNEPQHHACPQCDSSLVIDWRGSHDRRMPEILGLEETPIGSSDL